MDALNKKMLYTLSVLDIKNSKFLSAFKSNGRDLKKTLKKIMGREINRDYMFTTGGKDKSQSFKKLVEYVDSKGINVINISEPRYPFLLKEIDCPPLLLFIRGKKTNLNIPGIAVVGTRKFTHYGRDAAIYISEQLSRTGISVISGMATGIDYFAQSAALKEAGGSIGVIGCGIDIIYPYENKNLYEEITENGCIVTEFLPGTPPLKQNFPARNRIISGLSMGVIVVEAGDRSGALITSKFALEQNREVFSIPGSIFSYESRGCHNLIKRGAKLVEDIDDVLEELKQYADLYQSVMTGKRYDYKKGKKVNRYGSEIRKEITGLSIEQKEIYEYIGYKPIDIEEIVNHAKLSTGKVLQVISELQFRNLIIEKNLNEFVRV